MDLGAVTLAGTTVLDTGNNALGILNVGAVTSATNALTWILDQQPEQRSVYDLLWMLAVV